MNTHTRGHDTMTLTLTGNKMDAPPTKQPTDHNWARLDKCARWVYLNHIYFMMTSGERVNASIDNIH